MSTALEFRQKAAGLILRSLAHKRADAAGLGGGLPTLLRALAGSFYKGETAILSLIPRRPSLHWERMNEGL